MTQEQKKNIDKVIAIFMYCIFLPFVLLALITKGVDKCMEFLFNNCFNPLYWKLCKLIRKPIPNSVVNIKKSEDKYYKRINDELLTIKEAKLLGKEYENKGYEVQLSLSEF